MKKVYVLIVVMSIFATTFPVVAEVLETPKISNQKNIRMVDKMPNSPTTFKLKDWKDVTNKLDKLVFDVSKTGTDYLPIGYFDDTKQNIDFTTFGLPSYVGHDNGKGATTMIPGNQEGITTMSAVLNATLAGIDKSNQNGIDYVKMMRAFLVKDEGVVLNRQKTQTGYTFWYELTPQLQFNELAFLYPNVEGMKEAVISSSEVWYKVVQALLADEKKFNYTSYSISKKEAVDNGKWLEPHSAAGLADVMFGAYKFTNDEKYLKAAMDCMDWLEGETNNPYYEILLDYVAVLGARLNAEYGKKYDVEKFINWTLDGDSKSRPGLGVITGKWGEYDADGIIGSQTDGGGYAFAMNTFHAMGYLLPVVKYDQRYARAIGKLLLNSASNARLFFPDELSPENQTCWWWKGDPEHVIAYEGLRKEWQGKSPVAMGDPTVYGWGNTDLGLYGGTAVGIFGGIIEPTNVEKILKLNCNVTDFYSDKEFPTFLYYNPYNEDKNVEIDVGNDKFDIFDSVTRVYLKKNVSGKTEITIPADNSIIAVLVPADSEMKTEANAVIINDKKVAYDKPSISIISHQKQNETVEGVIKLKTSRYIPSNDKFKKATVSFNGKNILATEILTNEFEIDTMKLQNTYGKLAIEIETQNGLKDKSSVVLSVFNEKGDVAFSADAKEIAEWNSSKMKASVSLEKDVAVIKESSGAGFGAIESPSILIDLDRKPQMVLNVDYVQNAWVVQTKFEAEEWGFYTRANETSTGKIVIDIVPDTLRFHPEMKYKGENNMQFYLMASGKVGANIGIKSMKIIYPEIENKAEKEMISDNFTEVIKSENIKNWKPLLSKAIFSDNVVTISSSNGNRFGGIVSGVFGIDLDTNPIIEIDVKDVSNKWALMISFLDDNSSKFMQVDTNIDGKLKFDINKAIKNYDKTFDGKGLKSAYITIFTIGDNSKMKIDGISSSYLGGIK